MTKKQTTPGTDSEVLELQELASSLLAGSTNTTISFDGSEWVLKGTNTNDYKELAALVRSKPPKE